MDGDLVQVRPRKRAPADHEGVPVCSHAVCPMYSVKGRCRETGNEVDSLCYPEVRDRLEGSADSVARRGAMEQNISVLRTERDKAYGAAAEVQVRLKAALDEVEELRDRLGVSENHAAQTIKKLEEWSAMFTERVQRLRDALADVPNASPLFRGGEINAANPILRSDVAHGLSCLVDVAREICG